ncbi:MAG: glycosyltransferase family 4 protein [Gammaproteobacteria bacterium]|jgi:glycosyltransferase involved in cell wall biosynthesis|nr:glycosyltransferase family 4 protein [Gammaproteobacteria bacterium]
MENKKTVAVMCFSGNSGGMEIDSIKLARLLNETCDVTLFCKKDSFIHNQLKNQSQIKFVPVNFMSRIFSLSMFFSVRKEIKARRISNVIFFGSSELKTLYVTFLGFPMNVIVRHGTTKSHKKAGFLYRIIYSYVNYHIALSKHLLANVKKIVPQAPEAAYKIIYPSYQVKTKTDGITASVPHDDLRITHVGRIAPGKGQIDAVRACANLYHKKIPFQLDLLGGTEGEKNISVVQSEIKEAAFSDHVHMRGHVSNVTDYLRMTDIFLFPSEGEGMPNAFIEAMHNGAVCIAYKNTVFPEFVEMGFYIHLVSDGDIDALSQKLVQIAINIKDEKMMSENNVELVESYFQVKEELAQWLKILA